MAIVLLTLWYALLSAVTLAFFAIDKSRAGTPGARRISEKTLHLLELLGGFPGAFLAMRFLHHKNRKASFFLITFAIAILHLIVWCAVVWVRSQA